LIASLLTEVCHEVQIEAILHLQLLSGDVFDDAAMKKEDGAHLHASLTGFLGGRC